MHVRECPLARLDVVPRSFSWSVEVHRRKHVLTQRRVTCFAFFFDVTLLGSDRDIALVLWFERPQPSGLPSSRATLRMRSADV